MLDGANRVPVVTVVVVVGIHVAIVIKVEVVGVVVVVLVNIGRPIVTVVALIVLGAIVLVTRSREEHRAITPNTDHLILLRKK